MLKGYTEWLNEAKEPLKKNGQGGFDPQGESQTNKFKKVDLITLPQNVEGTNCSNCRFVGEKDGKSYCEHKDVHEYVTKRMCCALWDNKGVMRRWKD